MTFGRLPIQLLKKSLVAEATHPPFLEINYSAFNRLVLGSNPRHPKKNERPVPGCFRNEGAVEILLERVGGGRGSPPPAGFAPGEAWFPPPEPQPP